MLTLVITPGGKRRVVTIAEALYYLGVDIGRKSVRAERTPEEQGRHRAGVRREYRRRALEQQRGPG